ncbi:MAG: transposase [Cyanobacteria bacterium J06639_1]
MLRRQAQQKAFRNYMTGLLSDRHRDPVAQLVTNQSGGSYSGLRHYLRSAPWNADAVNERRIESLYACRQTKPRRGFTLVVDDSSHAESAAVAAGVERQFVTVNETKVRYVMRATHLTDGVRNIPLDLHVSAHPYPERDLMESRAHYARPDIILQLIDRSLARKYRPGTVYISGGYSLDTFLITQLQVRELTYVAALLGSSQVECQIPGIPELQRGCLRDLLHQIPPMLWIPARTPEPDAPHASTERWTATLRVKLSHVEGWHWLVISIDRPSPGLATNIVYLASNASTRAFSPASTWAIYSQRQMMAEFYRDARSLLNLSEYCLDSPRSLMRHWMLLYAAYTFITWHQLTGSLQRQTQRKISSFSEAVDAYRAILAAVKPPTPVVAKTISHPSALASEQVS